MQELLNLQLPLPQSFRVQHHPLRWLYHQLAERSFAFCDLISLRISELTTSYSLTKMGRPPEPDDQKDLDAALFSGSGNSRKERAYRSRSIPSSNKSSFLTNTSLRFLCCSIHKSISCFERVMSPLFPLPRCSVLRRD